MLKLISNLFNKKEDKIISKCDHILEIIAEIQDNIRDYQRLHEENISICDEMLAILKRKEGDKE